MKKTMYVILFALALMLASAKKTHADEGSNTSDTQEVAKKLQNPVSSLISVPFQNNFQYGLGPDKKGSQYILRFQPVIPVSINTDWNMIFRPILPFITQHSVVGHTSQTGLSDLELELFFSPKDTGPGNIIWGVGPILLFPTATDNLLGYQKWGVGPSAVVLTQRGPWTIGMLADHLFSYTGNSERKNISVTYLQPFMAHSSKKGLSVNLSSETSYDWKGGQWSVPLIGGVSQIIPVFGHLISGGVSALYYAKTPLYGPEWGIRATLTLLFINKHE